MKIATLLPSATEIVCALGLEDQLAAVSHSCSFPAAVRHLPRVTSTRVPYNADSKTIDTFVRDHLSQNAALYDLDVPELRAIAPEVIISQDLCDVCAVSSGDVLAALRSLPSRPTLIDLTPSTLGDVLADISRVGGVLNVAPAAAALVAELTERRQAVERITRAVPREERPTVAFLEWLVPPFNAGHWNPELVELAGGVDLLGSRGQPSTTQSWDDIVRADPDILFIASCGYSIERTIDDLRHASVAAAFEQLRAARAGRIYVADGEYFSCPGPRLLDGLELLAHVLRPDDHGQPGNARYRTVT